MASIYERTEVRHQGMDTATIEWCDYWHSLDVEFDTSKKSPLHHDNRCTYCGKTEHARAKKR